MAYTSRKAKRPRGFGAAVQVVLTPYGLVAVWRLDMMSRQCMRFLFVHNGREHEQIYRCSWSWQYTVTLANRFACNIALRNPINLSHDDLERLALKAVRAAAPTLFAGCSAPAMEEGEYRNMEARAAEKLHQALLEGV